MVLWIMNDLRWYLHSCTSRSLAYDISFSTNAYDSQFSTWIVIFVSSQSFVASTVGHIIRVLLRTISRITWNLPPSEEPGVYMYPDHKYWLYGVFWKKIKEENEISRLLFHHYSMKLSLIFDHDYLKITILYSPKLIFSKIFWPIILKFSGHVSILKASKFKLKFLKNHIILI